MLKDISIGKYYAANSFVHKLDPRLKIISTFAFLIYLFFFNSLISLCLSSLLLLFIIKVSKVPLSYFIRGLKPLIFIIIFTSIINLFMTDGRIIFKFYFLKVSYEGILKTVFVSLRLVLLIIASTVMTFTTTQLSLTYAIEALLNPLKAIKVPAHEIAMMMGIALRFIPTLIDESDKIVKAQMARGAEFDSKNILKKAKSFLPLLVPIFVSSFKRAVDLAMAMEARCYRGAEGRTRLKNLKYTKNDAYSAYFIIISLNLLLIADRMFFKVFWSVV